MVIRGPCPTSFSHTAAQPPEPQTSHRWRCPALGTCPRAAQPSRDRGWSLCPFEHLEPSFKPGDCHQVSHHFPTSGEGQDALWEVRAMGAAKASDSTGMSSVLALCPWAWVPAQVLNPQSSVPSASTSLGLNPALLQCWNPQQSPGKPKGAELRLLWSWGWDRDVS